jgi:mannose-6-phosphate isomerase-like protein (cupin superfamily)
VKAAGVELRSFKLGKKEERTETMKKLWLLCLFGLALLPVAAQETAPEGFQLWSAVSLKQLGQKLHEGAVANPNHIGLSRLADYSNDLFMLSRREADGVPEWHETQVDLFVVESGSATLIVGGTMVGAKDTEPHEKRNGTIQGGMRHKLSAGDIVRIPVKTPHQVLLDGSKEFTYFVIKIKGY